MTRCFRKMAFLALMMLVSAPLTGATAAEEFDIEFSIGEDVSREDIAYIEEGIRLAQEYLDDTLGVSISGSAYVQVRSRDAFGDAEVVAVTSGNIVMYFTESIGWRLSSPATRVEVVVHEFIHVYQGHELEQRGWIVPAWMVEGAAEYLATDALVTRGLRTWAEADAYRYWTIADADDLLDRLDAYEQATDFQQADARVYGLAYLGMAWLARAAGDDAIADFFRRVSNGAGWEAAFGMAFQITPQAFYQAFEEQRAEFIRPVNPPAAFDLLGPADSASPVRLTELPETVIPGEQLLVQARSEPDARCIAYLWGPELDLAHETTADGAANLFWLVTIPPETPAQTAELSVDCGSGPILAEITIEG